MAGFEQAFADTEEAAEAARKSAANVVSQARALVKDAQTGKIAGIKRGPRKLEEAVAALRQEVSNVGPCWPFTDEEEQRRLAEGYAEELKDAATGIGLAIRERDDGLISHPSVLRVLPAERAVRVDGKKVSTIRPTYLAGVLRKNQGKSSRYSTQRFLEALYAVYTDISRRDSLLPENAGPVVRLARIYKLMTALPGAGRDYGRGDFARDLYVLESEGPRRTRSGAAVSFPASTGTKRPHDLFSFIGPDGNGVEYYGIRFGSGG